MRRLCGEPDSDSALNPRRPLAPGPLRLAAQMADEPSEGAAVLTARSKRRESLFRAVPRLQGFCVEEVCW